MFDVEALANLIDERVRKAVREELAKAPAPGPEFLTIAEAAVLVSVSPSTIGEWFREKKLARYGKGRAVRVKRAELLGLMESEREQTDSDKTDAKALARKLLAKAAH